MMHARLFPSGDSFSYPNEISQFYTLSYPFTAPAAQPLYYMHVEIDNTLKFNERG